MPTNDIDSDLIKKVLLALLVTVLVILVGLFFYFQVFSRIGRPVLIEVEVTLENRCELPDDVFMVKAMPNGPQAAFSGGKARLMAFTGKRVKLVANSRFPGFNFEGDEANVAPRVTLEAVCESQQRFRDTSKSMREGFNSGH
ncbi:MAG: hypothetical protein RLZZ344_1207 [Pseudomonadota bacterium]|jgi:hypothetical protein